MSSRPTVRAEDPGRVTASVRGRRAGERPRRCRRRSSSPTRTRGSTFLRAGRTRRAAGEAVRPPGSSAYTPASLGVRGLRRRPGPQNLHALDHRARGLRPDRVGPRGGQRRGISGRAARGRVARRFGEPGRRLARARGRASRSRSRRSPPMTSAAPGTRCAGRRTARRAARARRAGDPGPLARHVQVPGDGDARRRCERFTRNSGRRESTGGQQTPTQIGHHAGCPHATPIEGLLLSGHRGRSRARARQRCVRVGRAHRGRDPALRMLGAGPPLPGPAAAVAANLPSLEYLLT